MRVEDCGLSRAEELLSLRDRVDEVVLVDASWLLHKSYYGYSSLSYGVGGVQVNTGDIYGFLLSLVSIAKRKPFATVVLCLDSPSGRYYRAGLVEGYKGTRDDEGKSKIYSKLADIIRAASVLQSVFVSVLEGYECDDLIYTLATAFSGVMDGVYIYSKDNDMMQIISDRVKVFKAFENDSLVLLGREDVVERFGVEPGEVPLYRALVGDKSDNLAGYSRFPKKMARELASRYGTVDELLDRGVLDYPDNKWVRMVVMEPDILRSNYTMMRLESVAYPSEILFKATMDWGVFDKYGLQALKGKFEGLVGGGASSGFAEIDMAELDG